MKHLILGLACAALLIGCATDTDTDTTSDRMGTSGTVGETTTGSATNSQGNARSPIQSDRTQPSP